MPALLAASGLSPRQALRERKSPAGELGLLALGVNDEHLALAMVAHPVLVKRPIIATPDRRNARRSPCAGQASGCWTYWTGCHPEGTRRYEMPCHHNLQTYMYACIEVAGLTDGKAWLFQ